MRIGVDLDGCVYNFVDALRHCERRSVDDFPDPCYYEVWRCWKWDRREFVDTVEYHTNHSELFFVGEPYDFAVGVLDTWRRRGHSIHFITDRGHSAAAMEQTHRWLDKNNIVYDSLTFTSGIKAQEVRVDVLIDDKPYQVRKAWQETNCRGILIPRLYNSEPDGCRDGSHSCKGVDPLEWTWNDLRDSEYIR